MNVKLEEKQIIVDGKPIMVMAGEIHYYRLLPQQWQPVIDELKATGMNAVASYIPWVVHEQVEGDVDLEGRNKPQYDLISFLKLVEENDLYFIARPGPYVMAEMVGDGIPPWVKQKYPSCIPNCWNGAEATTVDLDYLDPGFLKAAEKWYSYVIPEIAKYNSKNILGIQLDNEMGMLAWVSNCPVLNDGSVNRLIKYIEQDNRKNKLSVDLSNFEATKSYAQKPVDSESAVFHDVLMDFFRQEIKEYTEILESWTHKYGIGETIYMINIHGTGGGKLFGYPIGISQLYKAFEGKTNYLCGSDIYYGDLKVPTIHDTYLANAMTEAINGDNQPLTSLEFNSTDADFGFNHGGRVNATTASLRARLMLSQGNKLLNYYLFSGGFNDYMEFDLGNGINRIASTGEKHGFGAPIRPDLTRNYIFDDISYIGNLVKNLNSKLATMKQQYDTVNIAFIPDYFKNEFVSPDCPSYQEIVNNIKRHAMDGANEVIIRYLLLRNYMPTCINIQDKEIDINKTKVLVVNSALYMAEETQQNLVNFIKEGGKLFVYGEMPMYNLHGDSCTLLIDELGIKVGEEINFSYPCKKRISITPCGFASHLPACFRENATVIASKLPSESFLQSDETKETLGLYIEGKAAIISTDYRCDMQLFDLIMEKLEAEQLLTIDSEFVGINANILSNGEGETFISVLNLDDINRIGEISYNNEVFNVELEKLGAMMLPVNIKTDEYTIVSCNNELFKYDEHEITFKLSGTNFELKLETDREIEIPNNFKLEVNGSTNIITSESRMYDEKYVTIEFG